MSHRKHFPVYIGKEQLGPHFCGHQHSTQAAATRCAENQAKRHRAAFEVIRINKDGRETVRDVVRFPHHS